MKRLIYDLPTRLFHWSFAGLFLGAFAVAKTIDDDNPLFSLHMLAGLVLSAAVVLRLIWGLVGTKHARFSGFTLHPRMLWQYLRNVMSGPKQRWVGHNPASSWAALVMMMLALGLGATGFLMTSAGDTEAWEDVHELLANALLLTAVAHVSGVILHMIRHRDHLGLSMLHGRKEGMEPSDEIPGARSAWGAVGVLLLVGFAGLLLANYNPSSRTLNFFGTSLTLGESEEDDDSGEREKKDEHEENDD